MYSGLVAGVVSIISFASNVLLPSPSVIQSTRDTGVVSGCNELSYLLPIMSSPESTGTTSGVSLDGFSAPIGYHLNRLLIASL